MSCLSLGNLKIAPVMRYTLNLMVNLPSQDNKLILIEFAVSKKIVVDIVFIRLILDESHQTST